MNFSDVDTQVRLYVQKHMKHMRHVPVIRMDGCKFSYMFTIQTKFLDGRPTIITDTNTIHVFEILVRFFLNKRVQTNTPILFHSFKTHFDIDW
jgi:hypothetical protein